VSPVTQIALSLQQSALSQTGFTAKGREGRKGTKELGAKAQEIQFGTPNPSFAFFAPIAVK